MSTSVIDPSPACTQATSAPSIPCHRHVQDRLSSATLSRCYFYSTFFYSKLREKRGEDGTRVGHKLSSPPEWPVSALPGGSQQPCRVLWCSSCLTILCPCAGGEIPVGTRLKPGATAAECQALRNYHKVQKWTKVRDGFGIPVSGWVTRALDLRVWGQSWQHIAPLTSCI